MSDRAARKRDRVIGYLEVAAAASLYGSTGIFSTLLVDEGVTPRSVALLRPMVGLIALALVAALFQPAAMRPGWRGFALMAGAGGAVTALFQLGEQLSFDAAGVTATVALLYLSPALVLAIAGPVLGEWPTRAQIGLALLSVAGVFLTVTGLKGVTIEWSPAGIGWGVLSAVAYTGYTLFGRVASPRYGWLATTLLSTLGGCVLLAITLPLLGEPIVLPTSGRAWTLLVVFGLLTQAIATGLFYDSLRRLAAGRVAITATLEPVVAAVLATMLLGQGLVMLGWLGLGMVVAGVAGAYALEESD